MKRTLRSAYLGYVVMSIINIFVPLLFTIFSNKYNISLKSISLLIAFNFGTQLFIDFISPLIIKRLGYKRTVLIGLLCAFLGILMLSFLPDIMPNHFMGIIISVFIYSVGGGVLEVLISPIVEAQPTENKEKTMAKLHSFYCIGCVIVILFSTIFLKIFKNENYIYLCIILSIVPLVDFFMFLKSDVLELSDEVKEKSNLFKNVYFYILILSMFCAGAAELSVSQWASYFCQTGLNLDKLVGDLVGPLSFALLMGLSRIFYSKFGDKINLDKYMMVSSVICIIAYILILLPNVLLNVLGCALCGVASGALWPGCFSKASSTIKNSKTTMFAFMALAGDLGCAFGPSLVGVSSDIFNDLNKGLFISIIFPIILLICLFILKKKKI